MHVLGSDVSLPLPAFSDRCLMELSVVPSDHLVEVPCAVRRGESVATDATSIDQVRFF